MGDVMEWSDLRIFLAIARRGTLGAAARDLHVTQPTMARRLRALEQAVPPDAVITLDTGDHSVWFGRIFGGTAQQVLLSGTATVRVADEDFGALGTRANPFAGKPFAVYVPPRAEARLTAESPCELAVGSAPAAGRFPPARAA